MQKLLRSRKRRYIALLYDRRVLPKKDRGCRLCPQIYILQILTETLIRDAYSLLSSEPTVRTVEREAYIRAVCFCVL